MKLKSLCGSFWLKEFVLTLAKESTEKKVKGIPVLSEEIHISQLPEYPEYPEYEEIDTQNKVLYHRYIFILQKTERSLYIGSFCITG